MRAEIDIALGPDATLTRTRQGFAHRPGQWQMAQAIGDVVRRGGVLLAEAGTGTGKTLAYLVPVLLSGRKAVISTATKTLQDQVVAEVIRLAQQLDRPIEVAAAKGRRNYLCLHRLATAEPADDIEHLAQQATIRAWAEQTPTGDIATVATVPEHAPIWESLTVGGDACLQKRCPQFEACFATRARARAEAADVVVANHHLYFADLAMRAGGGAALPDHDTVVFDEAHAAPEVAGLFFGRRVDSGQFTRLFTDTARILDNAAAVQPAVTATEALFAAIRPADGGRGPWDPHDVPPEINAAFLAVDDALDGVQQRLNALDDDPTAERLTTRATRLREGLSRFFSPTFIDTAVWFCEGHGSTGAALSVQPISPAEHLNQRLFERMRAVIAVSATLAMGDDFSYTRARLGAPADAACVRFTSPFDFARQARLYLPRHLPPPTDERYLDALVEEVGHLCALTQGRALVLFTSLRDMRLAFERARGRIDFPLAMQGQAPRATLLERLRSVPGTVLFATASFWTGVDVPGDALSCVIIARLPFGSPADPVLVAQLGAARAAGLDPFEAVQLPAAAITLKQGVGRLIRTEHDRGIVAILDGRLSRRRYGPALIAALPPLTVVHAPADLVAWWTQPPYIEP